MTFPRRPNELLRALLREAGWTQEALARAVNALGAEIGCPLRYDRTSVAHWLAGTQPRQPVPQLISEALSRRTGRSVAPHHAGFAAADNDPPGGDPVAGFAELCRADADAGHRMPMRQRPYRVVESVITDFPARRHGDVEGSDPDATLRGSRPEAGSREAPPVDQAAPDAPVAPRTDLREDAAGGLRDAAGFFAASIDTHGGHHARTALASYLADDVAPLLHKRHPARTRAAILTAASQLAFLLARMYQDGQLHGMAQRYYGHAHRLASEAGDRVSWCVAVRAMSAQADRLGHLASARHLAEAAGRAARQVPAAQQSYVRAQLAVVLARGDDRPAALAALRGAEQACERAADRTSPFAHYPSAALRFQASLTLEALGDLPAALAELGQSAAERPTADVRGRALTQARFGQLLLRGGRLDEACAAWRSFVRAQERLRSGETERALLDMRTALRPYRNRADAAELLARAAR